MDYGIKKELNVSYEEAIERVKEELSKKGFGVLTQIDVQSTLKKKLDIDFNKYIILGACNPNLAHQALQCEEEIGLLLPCNVIVYEKEQKVYVSAIDPYTSMSFINNETLHLIAKQVREKLSKVIKSL